MEIAKIMKEARSQNLLRNSEDAAIQLRAFREATPITPRKNKSSENYPSPKTSEQTLSKPK